MKKLNNDVAKRGPLGGSITFAGEKATDYSEEAIKNELKSKGLEAIEEITVKNTFTGKETAVTIRRDGTSESSLILALADPNLNRDQKDHYLSMYLFERGKDSASMIVDLMRYKGQHTKESRSFHSQMRFDFEMFANMFCSYLDSSARSIFLELGLSDKHVEELLSGYSTYLKEQKGDGSLVSFFASTGQTVAGVNTALIQTALRMRSQADSFRTTIQKVTEARLKGNGFGIYIDTHGKPYSIFDENEPLEGVVKADRERIEQVKKDEGL